jgi:hypothetical protein
MTNYSGIVSDISSESMFGIYILTVYLTFYLAVSLAFCLASVLTFCLAFYLACVRVQACPTACGAGDMVFGSRRAPEHPELAIWQRVQQASEEEAKEQEEEEDGLSGLTD